MNKVCGLDIHKDTIFMAVLSTNGKVQLKEFSTLTPDIEVLRDLLMKEGVNQVAMESTGIYWIPVWRLLEKHFDVKLVNPYYIKQIPGRKTDIKDAQWIATVLQKGLIRGSFIPEYRIRELREYERRYVKLCGQVCRAEQEIEGQLIKCNIRITSFTSRIGSATVMKVVEAIISGESEPVDLENYVHGRVRNRHKEKVTASLTGTISCSDIFLLRQSYQQLRLVEDQKAELVKEMEAICEKHYKNELSLLCTIPGVQKLSAMQILAEIGNDLSAFNTASQLTGWAGLRPRNDESAGKIKSRKTLHGNKYLRRILVQCAWSASRTKGVWFKTKFEDLCKRKSKKKALIAIARKLMVVIWHMITKNEEYHEYKPALTKEQIEKKLAYHRKQIDLLIAG
jgi:transposase